MTELFMAGICFGLLFFIMFCFGHFVFLFAGSEEGMSIQHLLISGFIIYFFLFEFFAFPMMILKLPLNILSAVWGVTVAVLVLLVCLKFGKRWIQVWKKRKKQGHSFSFYLMLLLIGLQCVFVALWSDNSADAAYYVANVSANVATNTINIYEPFTGVQMDRFYTRYLFGMYPVHNSVVCQLTGIHPLLYTKTVMSVVTVLLSYTVYAQIGRKLFSGCRENVWKFLCFLSVIQFFFHTVYSNASFLLMRGYEGKAILANVVLPFVLYLDLCLYDDIQNKRIWLMVFCAGIAGVDISMSALSIVPVAVTAVCISVIIARRAWRCLKYYIVCVLPSVGFIIVYLLVSRGYLVLAI